MMVSRRAIVCAVIVLASVAGAAAQSTVFVVRHAERADGGATGGMMAATDPELSDAGRARADSLAVALKDAGITAIYVTEFKRTQQTGAPLARALGVAMTTVPAKDTAALVETIKSAGGNVLVIGHSNSVPEVITALGVAAPVTVGDTEYDNLFVVRLGDKPAVLRLHYR